MTPQDVLVQLTEKQLDGFFQAVRALPADRLTWAASSGSRTALDLAQEVATVIVGLDEAIWARRVEWNADTLAAQRAERAKLTDLDEIERVARENTDCLLSFVRSLPESMFADPVQMPMPGEFNVLDLLQYHQWNLAYHTGQVVYIAGLIDGESAAT
jgi:uncharacterized damage-inducible protein DinB